MAPISLSQFRAAVQALDGHTLETLAQKQRFVLHVERAGLAFTVSTTSNVRRETWNQVKEVLKCFNEIKSFRPGDYADVTRNSSYVLAALKACGF